MKKENFIRTGKILKASGLKGFLKLNPLTDFPERFSIGSEMYLINDDGIIRVNNITGKYIYRIEDCIIDNNFFKIKFEGFDSIDDADKVTGFYTAVPEEDASELPDGFFYYYKLAGCKVFNYGIEIGTVNEITDYGSGDLLSVIDKNETEILIPLRKEFIKNIDIENKKIDVQLPDGMLL